MALELVAGPFPLQTLAEVAVTDLEIAFKKASYDDAIGVFAYSAVMAGLCVIQLDGTVCLRSKQNRANGIALDLQEQNGFLIHDSLFENGIRKLHTGSMTGDITAIFEDEATNFVESVHVRCADRYLKFGSGTIQYKPLDLTGSWTTECTISRTSGFSSHQNVSRTKKKDILAFVYDTGEVIFYNHVLKQQLPEHSYIGVNAAAWYSPKYDIYVALQSDDTVVIYANEVAPATLSDAEAITPITRGQVSKVKVQLLGSNSEPCVGELVNWSVSGAGTLLASQSKTDADGYAWNSCVVSPSATVSAAVDITAEVLF